MNIQTKKCNRCHLHQDIVNFYKSGRTTDGFRDDCKTCNKISAKKFYAKHKEKLSLKQKEDMKNPVLKKAQKIRQYNWRLKTYYGITTEIKDQMIKDQGYLCLICKMDFRYLDSKSINVDHCHKTNKVRGILCQKCNLLLGCAGNEGDSVFVIEEAIRYLEEFNNNGN